MRGGFVCARQLGHEEDEVCEREVGGAGEVDCVAGSIEVAPELGQVWLVPESWVGGEEHEWLGETPPT